MSRSLVVIVVALATFSQCLAGVAKKHTPTCQGNADPYNNCKTVSCATPANGGRFVRQVGPFTAPVSSDAKECLWILRAPNEQTITKLRLKSATIAPGDVLQFQDGSDIIAVTADQSVDLINQQLQTFERRKLSAVLVVFKSDKAAASYFDLDYQFA